MRASHSALAFCALAFVFAPATAPAAGGATYTGTLDGPGVVWVSDGSRPAIRTDAEVRQRNKTFVPDVVVVPVGSVVRFPNDDGFYHNVFSDGDATPFDLGLYDVGPGKSVTFDKSGVADVRCHIHARMHATIVVVDGPYVRVPAAGRYEIADLRPGTHVLHVWTPDGGDRRTTIRI